jgi:energy-coupling factor transporter ATP-binding protein EcfA2
MSLDVDFNKDITLLVGINGSGKTTVLKVIDWLLKPDFGRLAVSKYDLLSLEFDEEGAHYKLSATKTNEQLTLSLEGPEPQLKPITVTLFAPPGLEEEEMEEQYRWVDKITCIFFWRASFNRKLYLSGETDLALFTSAHPSPLVRASHPDRWHAIPSQWAEVRKLLPL